MKKKTKNKKVINHLKDDIKNSERSEKDDKKLIKDLNKKKKKRT